MLGYCELTSPVQLSELGFQWSRRNELVEIIHEGRFSVNHEGLLTIMNVQPSDSGVYQVNISNDQGSAQHTVQLEVNGILTTTAPASTPTSPSSILHQPQTPILSGMNSTCMKNLPHP